MRLFTSSVTHFLIYLFAVILFASACSPTRRITRQTNHLLLGDSVLNNAHTGIAIYDATSHQLIYNYQGDKYFVPASNVKILSLYAGLKYLGDSLPGLHYFEGKDSIYIQGTGDPSFLQPDFSQQPVFDFLKKQTKPITLNADNWQADAWGNGWSWNDYTYYYMSERSAMPIYGNVVKWIQIRDSGSIQALARQDAFIYSEPDINWPVNFSEDTGAQRFTVTRSLAQNQFFVTQGKEENATVNVPFITGGVNATLQLLHDSLRRDVSFTTTALPRFSTIYSQVADSLYHLMMYRSDNFFAEQTLLMAAQQKLGVLNDKKMIHYLLQQDFKDLPQSPVWVDGSGLSRYNLVTPLDMVKVLQKLKDEFGMMRLQKIFPPGGKGTLSNYYKADSNYIFAKTGSLSGVVTLSGYLYTRKGKLLIFSFLVNNNNRDAISIRKKMEAILNKFADR